MLVPPVLDRFRAPPGTGAKGVSSPAAGKALDSSDFWLLKKGLKKDRNPP